MSPLPNIIFKLNLKISVYNKDKNTIKYISAYLDYSNEPRISDLNNYTYGFKEIDSIFKNNLNILNIIKNL